MSRDVIWINSPTENNEKFWVKNISFKDYFRIESLK